MSASDAQLGLNSSAVADEGSPNDERAGDAHVCALTTVAAASRQNERFYVLYRHSAHDDASEAVAPFVPLLQFFIDRGMANRLQRQRTHARSLALLLDYLAARGDSVATAPADALQHFVDDLVAGTTNDFGRDPTGLRWPPRSTAVVEAHLARITAFADWLSERVGGRSLNPWRTARPEERILQLRRFDRRAAGALLAHASYRAHERGAVERVRSVRAPRRDHRVFEELRAFDEKAFERLIEHGWSRRVPDGASLAQRFRLRDLMLSVLMHGGGLRVSEAFHLFVGDVIEDPDQPGTALVHLFHPERGQAPDDPGGPWRDREHYLRDRWGMRPRTLEVGALQAGWKNLALTDTRRKASRVYFFPTHWAELFWTLYRAYVRHRPEADHPWLFVSERSIERGRPYTIAAFEQAHARAVQRAGLSHGKRHGTSPHGHRHAYGLRLANAGIDRRVVQRALHHRSPWSQDVYTAAQAREVAAVLDAASQRMSDPAAFRIAESL